MSDNDQALLPCPFCRAEMQRVSDKEGEFYMHPGVVTDDDCLMSGQGVHPRNYAAWNRRATLASDTIGNGDGEAVDTLAASEAAPGVWTDVLAAPPAADEPVPSDAAVAAKAREALGTWLAWPDAPRDGIRPVTNEQVESWLAGLPNRLGYPPAAEPVGMREALEFYADPDTWIGVYTTDEDAPLCGDWSKGEYYIGSHPGAKARAALEALPSQEVEPAADHNPLAEPLRRALLAADNLLSELDAHQDMTGEHLEAEDQAVVDGAKEDMAYARAALKRHRALCDLAENDADLIGSETSASPVKRDLASGDQIAAIIRVQMREQWDEICADTQCHPLDIEKRGRSTYYEDRHWTEAVAKYAAQDILAALSTQAAYPTGAGEGRWEGVPELVDRITAEEGACVTFTGPNPDFNGLPNEAVAICNGRTGWNTEYFRADTLADCLREALAPMKEGE